MRAYRSWPAIPTHLIEARCPVSGIYRIDCRGNDSAYIGSAVDIRDRLRAHFRNLRASKHHSPYMQRSFAKYGEETFVAQVVEVVADRSSLASREAFWINHVQPAFNTALSIAGHDWSQTPEAKDRRDAIVLDRRALWDWAAITVREEWKAKRRPLESRDYVENRLILREFRAEVDTVYQELYAKHVLEKNWVA